MEDEIRMDTSGAYAHLAGVPKTLLPSGIENKRILDVWWEAVNKRHIFRSIFIVANQAKYKFFERWATANDFPLENVVNNGTTTTQTQGGSLSDVGLVLRSKNIEDDFFVARTNCMFYPNSISVWGIVQYFQTKDSDLLTCFSPIAEEKDGIFSEIQAFEMDQATNGKISRVEYNGLDSETESRAANPSPAGYGSLCPVTYCFKKETAAEIVGYMRKHKPAA